MITNERVSFQNPINMTCLVSLLCQKWRTHLYSFSRESRFTLNKHSNVPTLPYIVVFLHNSKPFSLSIEETFFGTAVSFSEEDMAPSLVCRKGGLCCGRLYRIILSILIEPLKNFQFELVWLLSYHIWIHFVWLDVIKFWNK